MKKLLALVLSVGALTLMVSPVLAFHDAGVARCSGCHTMHNSENGALIDADAPNGNPYLLRDATASDVCLSCHATSRGAVWGSDPLAPPPNKGAGNFVFLTEDNLNDARYGNLPANYMPGRHAGHNVVAPSKNAAADPTLLTAPGGTYPSSAMSCTSCHDPHGNEHFRLLYGAGYVKAGNYTFNNAAPNAEGVSATSSTDAETRTRHTAYKGGMSGWCGNCHGNYHNQSTRMVHKSGVAMGASIAQIYNQYNGSSDITGGLAATAYLPEVAFEDAAMTVDGTNGPNELSEVSCISCHRAHATSAPNAGRWDFNVGLLREDGVLSASYAIPNPYDTHQRSLCNKCHAKDAGDALE